MLAQQAEGAPGEPGDGALIDPNQVVDQDGHQAGAQGRELEPGSQARRGPAAPERDDDVRRRGELAACHLVRELDRRLDVPDATERHGASRPHEVGEVERRARPAEVEPGSERERTRDAARKVQLGPRLAHPVELIANVVGYGLWHQDENGPHAEAAGEQRGRQAVVRAQRPAGEDRALAAAGRRGK